MKQVPGVEGRVSVNDSFVGLWEWSDRKEPIFGRLRSSYDDALKVAAEFGEKRGALAKDTRFTEEGRRDELKTWTAANALKPLAVARQVAIPAAKRELDQRREKLSLEGPDRSDLAGAVMRGEIRSWLRGMKIDERSQALNGDVDPLIALAVVEAPAALSGVNPATHKRLVSAAIDALHPGERAKIAELERALETTQRAVAAAEGGIKSELLVNSRTFSGWLEGAALESEAQIYLRKDDAGTVRAIFRGANGKAQTRTPTEDDLALGKWIKDDDPTTHIPQEWLGGAFSAAA